nr:HNH endonuclease [Inhella sp.]
MPTAAPKPCCVCRALVRDGTARCDAHKIRPGSFADDRRGTRQERGYGRLWEQIREQVMQRDRGLCQVCLRDHDRVTPATEVDHRIPKSAWRRTHGTLAGCDDEANLQAICTPCHQAKTAREGRGGRISQKSPN